MVGLNPMWSMAQLRHQASGMVALSLIVLKPLCSNDHKMTKRLQKIPGTHMARLFSSACL